MHVHVSVPHMCIRQSKPVLPERRQLPRQGSGQDDSLNSGSQTGLWPGLDCSILILPVWFTVPSQDHREKQMLVYPKC